MQNKLNQKLEKILGSGVGPKPDSESVLIEDGEGGYGWTNCNNFPSVKTRDYEPEIE